jgi:carboxymethylenebutenolidase
VSNPGLLLIEAPDDEAARRFAAEGYAVAAPEQALPAEPSDRVVLAALEARLAELEAREDVDRERIAVVGFGAGGNYAYQLGCTSRRVAAVVAYCGTIVYPDLSAARPIQPLELALNLSCPALFHFGAEDEATPVAHVAQLETVLGQFAKRFEVERWSGAAGGFFNRRGPGYHEPSARAAWDRTLRFLSEELELE